MPKIFVMPCKPCTSSPGQRVRELSTRALSCFNFIPKVFIFSVPFNFVLYNFCDCYIIPVFTENLSIFFIPASVILLTLFTILPVVLLLST